MVTAPAFHVLGGEDKRIFLKLRDRERVEMPNGTLCDHYLIKE